MRTNEFQQTGVPGVFAAGDDMARMWRNATRAAAPPTA
ncbi:NAD(P)/FAD-dependent oxidoreductase [Massilia sp. P8910]|nr:NAD(P)/FAD-dependent oxidoreductase [Massilia sp. H27-R4]MCE3604441.1 NAD(P)/FAD-dependent oxidoreductase [Massilia antarctica]MCY0913918.1 NAD(P)/FAD-dependent oxidoreductase [Massilia sp. H27-R4]CUI04348.1 hypothetical protein BN2497_3473 [Janthinobacterium sp. CG23_2]CUU28134.1 hypothetical protein BN3177_3473 [Janthinobacterium sp. CG23_2]